MRISARLQYYKSAKRSAKEEAAAGPPCDGRLRIAVHQGQGPPAGGTTWGVPAVGDAAAVAAHAQALFQVRGEARGGDATIAVGTNALLVLPLVVHLSKHIHSRLVHDFCTFITQTTVISCLG